ncbi:MAG: glycerophosphodiester phosphodiesterase family protein [Acidimicrobiia bacterium]|nr:glycerophosphodiester phosphodiesterase family protein [Acidimicrobiia bacterium]
MTDTIHPFFDDDRPLPLAHQGGAAEEVQNSTAAFANASRLGYRYLDIDVQSSSDGVLVAFHDDTLEELTGLDGAVADRTWAELSEARLPNGEPLARFDDLLDTHPDARWNIEVKNDEATEPVVATIRRRGLDHRVCLNTFWDRRMYRIRRAARDLEPAYSIPIASTLWLKLTSYLPWLPYRTSADATQAPIRDRGIPVLDERYVKRAHQVGLRVLVWTINEPEEMGRLLDIGVDGILTDNPTVLKSLLQERGQWD